MTELVGFVRSTEETIDNRFSPKLTFGDRCFALCLHFKNHSWVSIAKYLNTHTRTVQMIRLGPSYKSVRDEANRMGQQAFEDKYFDLDRYDNFVAFLQKHTDVATHNKQSFDPSLPGWNPNRTATAKQGEHRRYNSSTGQPVVINIIWRDSLGDGAHKRGWYYLIADGGMIGPYATSSGAFEASKTVWDYAATTPNDQNDAAIERANAAAKLARTNMEMDPSEATVVAFMEAANEAMVAASFPPGDIRATLLDPTFWRTVTPNTDFITNWCDANMEVIP